MSALNSDIETDRGRTLKDCMCAAHLINAELSEARECENELGEHDNAIGERLSPG